MEQHGVKKLVWLTNSPHLNPIENFWKVVKNKVQHNQIVPKNLEELRVTLERESTSIDCILVLIDFFHSMPNRLVELIKAKR